MADKASFWKGISAGFLAGMTVAAALRYTPFERFIAHLSPRLEGEVDEKLAMLEAKLGGTPPRPPVAPRPPAPSAAQVDDFFAQPAPSHAARSTEEDAVLTSARSTAVNTEAVANYLRAGAGSRSSAMLAEKGPERADPIDQPTSVRAYPRRLDLGSAG